MKHLYTSVFYLLLQSDLENSWEELEDDAKIIVHDISSQAKENAI